MKNYITLILMAISSFCYGIEPIDQPHFSGEIKDNQVLKVDSVRIAFFENYVGGAYGVKLQTIKVDVRGSFEFHCPIITKPGRLSISVYHGGKGYLLNNYIVEPADTVHMIITKNQDLYFAKYSGAGSAKYNLIDQLVRQHERSHQDVLPLELNTKVDINTLAFKLQKFDDIIIRAEKEKLHLINRSAGTINKTMLKLIKYSYGPNFIKWDTRLYQLYTEIYEKNDSIKKLIVNHFNHNKNRMCYKTDSMTYNSHPEVAFLWSRENISLYYNSKGVSSDLGTFYNVLATKYRGEVFDHLLARIFLFPRFMHHISYTNSLYDSLILDCYSRIQTTYLKNILVHKLKVQKGNKLNTAEFTDLQGRSFNVNSLLGKVFLLDVWGEGCTGCAEFHKKFKTISHLFKDDPRFACLSISIDKRKDKWIEGIESGKFTSKDHINVYSGGLGIKHPFLQYYKVSAIPFLLLVDQKGYVYEQIDLSISSEDLKALISKALKEYSTR